MRILHQQQNRIADLEQQLAEKDKEVNKLLTSKVSNVFVDFKNGHDQQIRKQVCDKIREWCQNNWDYDDFMYFLDKIEKGEGK